MKKLLFIFIILFFSQPSFSIEVIEGTCKKPRIGDKGTSGKDATCSFGEEMCGTNSRAGRHGEAGRYGDTAEINVRGAKKTDVIKIKATCHGSSGGDGGEGGNGNICDKLACSNGAAGGHGGNGGNGGIIHIQSDEPISPKKIKFAKCPVLGGKGGKKGKAGAGGKKGKLKTKSGRRSYNGHSGYLGRVLITVEGKTRDITKYACPKEYKSK
jgi:hypothetical protein